MLHLLVSEICNQIKAPKVLLTTRRNIFQGFHGLTPVTADTKLEQIEMQQICERRNKVNFFQNDGQNISADKIFTGFTRRVRSSRACKVKPQTYRFQLLAHLDGFWPFATWNHDDSTSDGEVAQMSRRRFQTAFQ